jgi:hypothetical protein
VKSREYSDASAQKAQSAAKAAARQYRSSMAHIIPNPAAKGKGDFKNVETMVLK